MAKGHRSQIKRERNEQKDTRPSAKISYARVSVQKACFVLGCHQRQGCTDSTWYFSIQSKICIKRYQRSY